MALGGNRGRRAGWKYKRTSDLAAILDTASCGWQHGALALQLFTNIGVELTQPTVSS